MKTMLFNPYNGNPRHPSDIASDPAGLLMLDPDEPVLAAEPKRFIGSVSVPYKCTDCGHIQQVTEVHTSDGVYVGSGANWCDKCNDGKPERLL
jgi:hypothetical protein